MSRPLVFLASISMGACYLKGRSQPHKRDFINSNPQLSHPSSYFLPRKDFLDPAPTHSICKTHTLVSNHFAMRSFLLFGLKNCARQLHLSMLMPTKTLGSEPRDGEDGLPSAKSLQLVMNRAL